MAHDYAKKAAARKSAATAKKNPPKKAPARRLPWAWLVIVLLLGGFGFLLYQLAGVKPDPRVTQDQVIKETQSRQASKSVASKAVTVSKVKPAQKSGKEYEFYKLLPESEVIPPEVKAYQSTPKSAANNSRYLLQAGSFKNPVDADAMRARLILMGMPNVTTNKATSASGSIWYRVRLGPFPSRSRLNKAYDQLVRLNIQPLQVKVP